VRLLRAVATRVIDQETRAVPSMWWTQMIYWISHLLRRSFERVTTTWSTNLIRTAARAAKRAKMRLLETEREGVAGTVFANGDAERLRQSTHSLTARLVHQLQPQLLVRLPQHQPMPRHGLLVEAASGHVMLTATPRSKLTVEGLLPPKALRVHQQCSLSGRASMV
jgi:hypothetical protein